MKYVVKKVVPMKCVVKNDVWQAYKLKGNFVKEGLALIWTEISISNHESQCP